jgi:hypothetical protein
MAIIEKYTMEEFKSLKRNAKGDLVYLDEQWYRLTDRQVNLLTGNDWSRYIELELDNDYMISRFMEWELT